MDDGQGLYLQVGQKLAEMLLFGVEELGEVLAEDAVEDGEVGGGRGQRGDLVLVPGVRNALQENTKKVSDGGSIRSIRAEVVAANSRSRTRK